MNREKALQLYIECGGESTSRFQEDRLVRYAEAVEAQVLRDFGDALTRWQAPTEKALDVVNTMSRVTSAVVAWRDKHQLKQGDMLEGADVLELAVSVVKLVGWYEPPKPIEADAKEVIREFIEERKQQMESEGNKGLKR